MRNQRAALSLEIRQITDGATVDESGKLRGLAIPFNSWTTIGSGDYRFRERVAPGAVTKTLAESDCVLLDNHDPARPIARMSAGTLRLDTRGEGVFYEADPAPTSYAQDLVTNVKHGNTRGNSFGFECVLDKWDVADDGIEERTLLEIKLPEISAVTFPAYVDTHISARDAVAAALEARARFFERALRAKYSADQLRQMLKEGKAFKNPNGEPSYPIADKEDLANAIRAVGRGGADHDAIRAYIVRRAKALGAADMIPDNWNADGSVKQSNAAPAPAEARACPHCGASLDEPAIAEAPEQHEPEASTRAHTGLEIALWAARIARAAEPRI